MYGIIQSTLAKLHHPLVEDHLVLETIFIWIQVWSLKRGTTVLYYSTKITKISTPRKLPAIRYYNSGRAHAQTLWKVKIITVLE